MNFTDPEHKLIVEKVETLQKTLDRFYDDFRDDRRARGDMEITLKGVASTTKMVRDDIADQHKETERIVSDGIEEAVKPMESKLDRLVTTKSAVIHFIKQERKKPFWRFWRRK